MESHPSGNGFLVFPSSNSSKSQRGALRVKSVLVKKDSLQVRMSERVREHVPQGSFLPGQDADDARCIAFPIV